MLNLLKAEFHKLKTCKTFHLILSLMVIASIAIPIYSTNLRIKSGKEILLLELAQQQFLFLIIVIGIFSCFITEDFNSGVIKNLISYGHKRSNIVISKSISYYTGVVIISFIHPIFLTIINTVMNGYGEVFTLNSFLLVLRVALLMILIYTAMASIAILIAFISRNMTVTMVIYMLLDFIVRLGKGLSMKKEAVRVVYEKTIFAQPEIAVINNITFSQLLQVVAISLGTILFSTIIAVYVFKKVDIK